MHKHMNSPAKIDLFEGNPDHRKKWARTCCRSRAIPVNLVAMVVVVMAFSHCQGFVQSSRHSVCPHSYPFVGSKRCNVESKRQKSTELFLSTLQSPSSSYSKPDDSVSPDWIPDNEDTIADRLNGLSKFHQSILSRVPERQQFVTGRYPLIIKAIENPTRKWLRTDWAETEILVNGTCPPRSLASFDRFQWLDPSERKELKEKYSMLSFELIAEIQTHRPGYLQVFPSDGPGVAAALARLRNDKDNSKHATGLVHGSQDKSEHRLRDRLWVTGFSLVGRKGVLHCIESDCGSMSFVQEKTSKSLLWPNEVACIPSTLIGSSWKDVSRPPRLGHQDALLVCDGFLVPGKDRGGIYVVKNPGSKETESTVCLTGDRSADRWFYHRAAWADLTGDGRQSILTARCQVSPAFANREVAAGLTKFGQLVWLECPNPHSMDPDTGAPLESDGMPFDPFDSRHLPWREHVLAEGPDVMFSVADMDPDDDTIEVISSEFFRKNVGLYSIQRSSTPRVTLRRVIDSGCGSAFSCVLANLGGVDLNLLTESTVISSGSTVNTAKPGDKFSHLLVTSHECTYSSTSGNPNSKKERDSDGTDLADLSAEQSAGGALFSYSVPPGKGAWRDQPWTRTTLASGFKVNGHLNNMINPGAPGFVYTFHPQFGEAGSSSRPLIAVAGDCSESAYVFRPEKPTISWTYEEEPKYSLMVEVQCGATVGSIGVGYDSFNTARQEEGYAKLYIPCHEKDKILVFALGSGEAEASD